MDTRIRELREAQGLSRRELADRAGLSYTALTKWESGTNEIGFDKAVVIARALRCDVSDLVTNAPQHDYEFDHLARNYRAMAPEGRAALLATSDALAAQFPLKVGGGGRRCLTKRHRRPSSRRNMRPHCIRIPTAMH